MTFAEVLPALIAGRKAMRRCWTVPDWVRIQRDEGLFGSNGDALPSFAVAACLLASDWELVEEPAKPAPACESCVNLRKHIEVREASETEARATIARLERELAEAKRPKERSRMLILAARAFADEHRVSPSEPVDVECSFVDWLRSELIGASCVLPKSNVVLSPHEALCEGELRVKP